MRLDENAGPGGAWAVGLSGSRVEHVCKLDADDWHLDGSLEEFAVAFETDPWIGIVARAVFELHEDSGTTQRLPVQVPIRLIGAEELRTRTQRPVTVRKDLSLNPGLDVEIFPYAISDEDGRAVLHLDPAMGTSASLRRQRDEPETVDVEMRTIDSVVFDNDLECPTAIK